MRRSGEREGALGAPRRVPCLVRGREREGAEGVEADAVDVGPVLVADTKEDLVACEGESVLEDDGGVVWPGQEPPRAVGELHDHHALVAVRALAKVPRISVAYGESECGDHSFAEVGTKNAFFDLGRVAGEGRGDDLHDGERGRGSAFTFGPDPVDAVGIDVECSTGGVRVVADEELIAALRRPDALGRGESVGGVEEVVVPHLDKAVAAVAGEGALQRGQVVLRSRLILTPLRR